MSDEERRRIGQEIKMFLAVNGIDRGRFAEITGLGKSTIDKLVTGIYSDNTLSKVINRSNFKLKTLYAAKILGSYSKVEWEGYLRNYLMLHPAIDNSGAIQVLLVSIEWSNSLPGLVLVEGRSGKTPNPPIGALWIPAARSPLIYIQPVDEIGVRLIVSTMVGEPAMRGLVLTVANVLANAYIPIALPVVLRRLDADAHFTPDELGRIGQAHPKFSSYRRELKAVMDRQYGRFATLWATRPHETPRSKLGKPSDES